MAVDNIVPYYDRDGITIYNGDCADVLATLDPSTVDLVLTDPPYGINLDTNYSNRTASTRTYTPIHGDGEAFDPAALLAFGNCILWGANYYSDKLPPGTWIVWDKVVKNGITAVWADAELAWSNSGGKVRVFRHMWNGAFRDSERGFHVHPTQKPVSLMRWVIERHTKLGDLVLDPYMGSGPVAQACADLGRRYIGVEMVEDYCRIAVDRLRQGTLLFEEGA